MLRTGYFLFVLGVTSLFSHAQYTAIPDPVFEQFIIDQGWDSEHVLDGQVLTADINTITQLEILEENNGITDLTGIQDFTALEVIQLFFTDCTFIDFGDLPNLTFILASFHDNLTLIDVSGCENLNDLYFTASELKNLDVTNNLKLERLNCGGNNITELDVSNNILLRQLSCNSNQLNELDISNNTSLEGIGFSNNNITSINIVNNLDLKGLRADNNFLDSLDFSNHFQLISCRVSNNDLVYLNVANGNNTNFTDMSFESFGNTNLNCIIVDNPAYSEANWTFIDDHTSFVDSQAACDALALTEVEELFVEIYPNPVSTVLYLSSLDHLKTLSLFDISGKRVSIEPILLPNQIIIDVRHLVKGIYFLSIQGNNKVITQNILIQ